MGLLILTLYLVSVLAAKTVSFDAPEGSNKVSYKDHQAIRLGVGDNASKIKRMIRDLSLSTWNGDPQANNYVDLVVPNLSWRPLETRPQPWIAKLCTKTLRPLSRQKANTGHTLVRSLRFNHSHGWNRQTLNLTKALLPCPGLIFITLTQTTSASSQICNLFTPYHTWQFITKNGG